MTTPLKCEGNSQPDAVWRSLLQYEESLLRKYRPKVPWTLSKAERENYWHIFHACDTRGKGFISNAKALEICRRTGIDSKELAKIWDLIHVDYRGKLNLVEFEVAMGLVHRILGGNILPANLPTEVVPSPSGELDRYADLQRTVLENDHGCYTYQKSFAAPPWLELYMVSAPDVLCFGYGGSRVVRLSTGIILKYGGHKNNYYEELRCLQYVRRVTSIPVPRPLHHPRRRSLWYLCMKEAPGITLESCIDNMTTDQLDHIILQLKSHLAQLRSLHPLQPLGSVTRGPYSNAMFPIPPKHSLQSVKDFNQYWHDILMLFCASDFADELISQLPSNCAVSFTHADLVPRNFMVQDSTITPILDWAFAGWYPEYWEYCRMRSCWDSPNWAYVVHSIYQPREREWAAFYKLTSTVWDVCG